MDKEKLGKLLMGAGAMMSLAYAAISVTTAKVNASGTCCNTSYDCPGSTTCWDPKQGQRACQPNQTGYCS